MSFPDIIFCSVWRSRPLGPLTFGATDGSSVKTTQKTQGPEARVVMVVADMSTACSPWPPSFPSFAALSPTQPPHPSHPHRTPPHSLLPHLVRRHQHWDGFSCSDSSTFSRFTSHLLRWWPSLWMTAMQTCARTSQLLWLHILPPFESPPMRVSRPCGEHGLQRKYTTHKKNWRTFNAVLLQCS